MQHGGSQLIGNWIGTRTAEMVGARGQAFGGM
jgi:hypothetical protein